MDIEDQEEQAISEEMDSCLAQAWLSGDDEAFDQIIHLILNENIPVDYQHSDTLKTSLIVAAARGNLQLTEQLIELGAKIDIVDPKNNRNAYDWAKHFNQDHVADYLQGKKLFRRFLRRFFSQRRSFFTALRIILNAVDKSIFRGNIEKL